MGKVKKSKSRTSKKDHLTVVMEHMDSKFDLLLEAHHSTNSLMDSLESRVENLEHGQRTTLDYLARIEAELHGEVKTKVGIKEFAMLEKRVERLERSAAKK